MLNKNKRPITLALAFSLLALLALAGCSEAKQVSIHDPVMIKEGDTYYLFSTGPGITMYSSSDMKNWRREGEVFNQAPSWASNAVPNFKGHLWAPDIIEKDGLFYLYYSVSAFGKNTSGIGVTVSPTLNPRAPNYGWQDKGMVLRSVPERDEWNAIDPNIVVDNNGTAWMAFGSFWQSLKMVALDSSWTKIAEPQQWHTIAALPKGSMPTGDAVKDGEIEAPFIFKKNDDYFLFVSWGKCCRKDESTYRLAIGRSKNATGPFLDKNGKDLAQGGGTLLISGNKNWPGLGHNSAYTFDGKDWLVLHAYESADNGLQKLKILEINWDKDGWPTVDTNELDEFVSIELTQ
ncbi:arabinan endo-1,5-alpha-L-arabinosidase [Saccharophagus degradans]|uniref:Extracellular exo-alpha-(1->5)-L-arabinofuranosidase n=1 Tax=Saccharophagus degradans TaxID=86304 RepID=A0AAW7X611_9GAMM|nr:arabinan endo-1,5-alpha-L-arabinosidase [Saccharophagus degradans]MDO6423138.1 arabinan endo-1,5-alpha-L-arabinosidase [Saccharophagus degradans]MDO6607338.1 arabinan endo-1,5-alpha-L-arabinosidase [Saccharophagus degradans]